MTMQIAKTRVDPVITEIVRNGVIAVTEEMKINLTRTAYNPIIYEALDFTVGLYTADGRTVSIGLGLPMFIRGMAETVKACTQHFGLENLNAGDVLITNDAYATDFPQRQPRGICLLHGALDRHRRRTWCDDDGYLFRRSANPVPEIVP